MRGMPGIRHQPGMRHLPRPGSTGGSCGCFSVLGLHGRRSRRGTGPGGTLARDRSGRGVRTAVPCSVTVWTLPGRVSLARRCAAPRPAALTSPAPSQRRDTRRSAALHCGCRKAPLASSRRRHSRRPVQGRKQGGGVQPQRLAVRRESVVTTVELARLGSDDALRRRTDNPETRSLRGVSQSGARRRKSAGKCQTAKTQFFSRSAKEIDPDVRPCLQGGIGCPVSGARGHFAMRD